MTSRAWHVFYETGSFTRLQGYQSTEGGTLCKVVSACTKAFLRDRDEPALLVVHNATLVEDPNEFESLMTYMDLASHGIQVDLRLPDHGGDRSTFGLSFGDSFLPFCHDEEKIYIRIMKPSMDEIDGTVFQEFELNSPIAIQSVPHDDSVIRRKRKRYHWDSIPLEEWQRRLGMAPLPVVRKTLENTTQHYLTVQEETRMVPHRHFRNRFKAFRHPRLKGATATDTIFPSVKTSQGHTCSQFFVHLPSKRWYVHPFKIDGKGFIL